MNAIFSKTKTALPGEPSYWKISVYESRQTEGKASCDMIGITRESHLGSAYMASGDACRPCQSNQSFHNLYMCPFDYAGLSNGLRRNGMRDFAFLIGEYSLAIQPSPVLPYPHYNTRWARYA